MQTCPKTGPNLKHTGITLAFFVLGGCGQDPAKQAQVVTANQMVRLTKQRVPVDPVVAARCRGDIPAIDGPHARAEAHLFANDLVLAYVKGNPDSVDFPIGSLFLKEKYHPGAAVPHLATTMTRIGNRGDIADWRFGMYSLPLHLPVAFNSYDCISCHQKYAENGFISTQSRKALREYLAAH